ncbi:LacI family DNA-binding transcriptional regulator [Listeria grayi]|nr:LacI family DNA-binding transcriptional regulator [Listeria grayi]
MKIRLKDIAQMAHVSETTASLVLNDAPSRISEAKRQEIKKIAKAHGYVPNFAARGLAMKKTNTIGLILPDITNPYFAALAKKIDDELRKYDYLTIVVNTDDKAESERDLIQLLLNRGADALIVIASNESSENSEAFDKLLTATGIPVLLLDRTIANPAYNQVSADDELGGFLATKHLIENGHRKIACITSMKTANGRERLAGYRRAMQEADLPIAADWEIDAAFKFEEGYTAAAPLVENKAVTAVFAASDLIAYGVIKQAQEAHLQIPEDLSLIGYDNLAFSKIVSISLTSIDQNIDLLGETAADLLVKRLTDKRASKAKQIKIKPVLIKNQSVKQITTSK